MKRYVYGQCVKGATHERKGLPLQDSKRVEEISEHITIVSVADGHGSDKCPRSDRGSLIAVNVFCNVVKKYLLSYGQTEEGMAGLVTFLNREGDMRFAQDICEEWQARVRKSFNKDKLESLFDDQGNADWKKVYALYGTTILGLLITDTFIFSFQIGDGDINIVTSDEVSPLLEAEKFLGTETHSLSKVDAWRNAASSLRRKEADSNLPYLYMLSTDGFINSYASENDFKRSCREYYEMIGRYGFDEVKDNLYKWLKETSELGCGDDITLVLAYMTE